MYPPNSPCVYRWGGRGTRSHPHHNDRPQPLPPRQQCGSLLRTALVAIVDRRDAADRAARRSPTCAAMQGCPAQLLEPVRDALRRLAQPLDARQY